MWLGLTLFSDVMWTMWKSADEGAGWSGHCPLGAGPRPRPRVLVNLLTFLSAPMAVQQNNRHRVSTPGILGTVLSELCGCQIPCLLPDTFSEWSCGVGRVSLTPERGAHDFSWRTISL